MATEHWLIYLSPCRINRNTHIHIYIYGYGRGERKREYEKGNKCTQIVTLIQI